MKVRAFSGLILVRNTVIISLLLQVYSVHVIVAAATTTARDQNYYKDVPKSKGCGSTTTISSSGYSAGDTSWYSYQTYKGQTLPVLYTLPSQYAIETNDKPVPLHLYFHGYGGTPEEGSIMFNDFANAKA